MSRDIRLLVIWSNNSTWSPYEQAKSIYRNITISRDSHVGVVLDLTDTILSSYVRGHDVHVLDG